MLHTALRLPGRRVAHGRRPGRVTDVHAVLAKMARFADAVRSGEWTGHTGERIRTVVNIGIGGSDLGPVMAYQALRAYSDRALTFRFVSNIDPTDVTEALLRPRPGDDAVHRLVQDLHHPGDADERPRRAAVAGRGAGRRRVGRREALRRGLDERRGGAQVRHRRGEHVRLLGLGRRALLARLGDRALAHGRDRPGPVRPVPRRHARDGQPLPQRAAGGEPAGIAGLLNVWYSNFFGVETHAVLPYSQYLHRLPAYLQQLTMESNGKSVRADGTPVTTTTGEIFWGEPGTNGQHAFYQLLHQGTRLVPGRLHRLRPAEPRAAGRRGGGTDMHDLFMGNLFAQSAALAFGKTAEEIAAEGTPAEIVPHKVMPGNRPSTTILAAEADPVDAGPADRLLRARDVRRGRDLGDRLVRPVGRRAGQGDGQAVRPDPDRPGSRHVGAGRLDRGADQAATGSGGGASKSFGRFPSGEPPHRAAGRPVFRRGPRRRRRGPRKCAQPS